MARFPEEQTEMYFWRHKLPEQIYEKKEEILRGFEKKL